MRSASPTHGGLDGGSVAPKVLGSREERKALLQVDALHVSDGAIQALRGITLGVGKGEVVALIGANGAGKTSTLRAVSGMLKPLAGKVHLAGADITGVKSNQLVSRGIAHAPEGRGIFLNLTVEENLELGAYLRRDAPEISEDMEYCFKLFPLLRERQKRTAATLSGGEQQMLAIAVALMSRPQLLLLDEPSLGLAPKMVQALGELIRGLRNDGMTILLVEQMASMALSLADVGYAFQRGQVVASGVASEMLRDMKFHQAYFGQGDATDACLP